MLLATNLDRTFLSGKSIHKQQLYQLLRTNLNVRLVFVTGRGLESVIPFLNDLVLPNPDYIICDVGATILNGHTLEPIHPLQAEIEKRWPGHIQIMDALKDIEGIFYQDTPQQRRCSYYVNDELSLAAMKERIKKFNCEMVFADGKHFDILPAGVNQGSSLKQLVHFLSVKESDVLVAGHMLNDIAMYECGFKGVVAGDAEQKLVDSTRGLNNICYAKAPGAGGILEAIVHFPGLAKLLKIPEQLNAQEAITNEQQLANAVNGMKI